MPRWRTREERSCRRAATAVTFRFSQRRLRGFPTSFFPASRRAVPGNLCLEVAQADPAQCRLFKSTSATATVPQSFARPIVSPVWSKIADMIQFREISS